MEEKKLSELLNLVKRNINLSDLRNTLCTQMDMMMKDIES